MSSTGTNTHVAKPTLPNLSSLSLLNGVPIETVKRKRDNYDEELLDALDEEWDRQEEEEEKGGEDIWEPPVGPTGPANELSPDMIMRILDQLARDDTSDETVCETAKSWCAVNKLHQETCNKDDPIWERMNLAIFTDPILGTFNNGPNQKSAFFAMCDAKKLANAVTKWFILEATRRLKDVLLIDQDMYGLNAPAAHSVLGEIDDWISHAEKAWKRTAGREEFEKLYVNNTNGDWTKLTKSDCTPLQDRPAACTLLTFTNTTIDTLFQDGRGLIFRTSTGYLQPEIVATQARERLDMVGKELGMWVVCLQHDDKKLPAAIQGDKEVAEYFHAPGDDPMWNHSATFYRWRLVRAGEAIMDTIFPDPSPTFAGQQIDNLTSVIERYCVTLADKLAGKLAPKP